MIVRKYNMAGRDEFTKQPYQRNIFKYVKGMEVKPLECKAPIYVVNDPSKKNGATLIGTEYGEIIEMLELSAYYSKTDIEETNDYCDDFEDFLTKYLSECKILKFAKEKTILKKGNEFYTSMKVLEAVSKTMCDVARTLTGVNPEEVNNWSWKSSTLPDGYRQQQAKGKDKGSYRYLCEQNHFNKPLSDDLTDVILIYRYLMESKGDVTIACVNSESTKKPYDYFFIDVNEIPEGTVQFVHNKNYSIANNCNYFVNRCNSIGYCSNIDLNNILPTEMFGHCSNLTTRSDVALLVVQ